MNKSDKLNSIDGTPPDLYIPPTGCPFYDRCDKAMKVCKDHMPEVTDHGEGHYSRCWLYHPMCKDNTERSDIDG